MIEEMARKMLTSPNATIFPGPMVLWASLVVILTGIGMLPGLAGLIMTLPLVGLSTWHAYRDVVRFKDD